MIDIAWPWRTKIQMIDLAWPWRKTQKVDFMQQSMMDLMRAPPPKRSSCRAAKKATVWTGEPEQIMDKTYGKCGSRGCQVKLKEAGYQMTMDQIKSKAQRMGLSHSREGKSDRQIMDETDVNQATHLVSCKLGLGNGQIKYTQPCLVLKEMPDGRLKILAFGDRHHKGTEHVKHVRMVAAEKVVAE